MWVSLKKPYKIIAFKEKQYNEHYQIPAAQCIVVPHTRRDSEMLCDVHWQTNDDLHELKGIMIDSENLQPVDPRDDAALFELWEHIYKPKPTVTKHHTQSVSLF